MTLAGPGPDVDPARLPLRRDLAHIRLAGVCFVPHYAIPLPFRVGAAGTTLHRMSEGEPVAQLPAGTGFDVLDIAGAWAWGQVGSGAGDGLVGYVPLAGIAPS